MTDYVAEKSEAAVYGVAAGAYTGWTQGDLIDLGGELFIVLTIPVQEGATWIVSAAPAREIGREAGSA